MWGCSPGGESRLASPARALSDVSAHHREQPVEDARRSGPQTVVLELVGDPCAQALDGAGRAQGVGRVDVHVVVVDGGDGRHLVGGQARGVVERGPVGAGGEEFRGLAQGAQGRVAVEHPWVYGLAREEQGPVTGEGLGGVELGEFAAYALGRPVRGPGVLSVDGLVHERVQRVSGVGERGLYVLLECVGQFDAGGRADEGVLEEVVQAVAAAGPAEQDAQGLERLDGQPVAAVQYGLVFGEVLGDAAGAFDVLRVARVVGGDLAFDARIRGAVDVVRVAVERGQAAGDDSGGEALGGRRQVVGCAEPAEALAENGPGAPPVTSSRMASQSRTIESARKCAR